MAKTAPIKRKSQSIHSRAAKRASSPSIGTAKSLKDIKPPAESSNFRPSVLAIHQGAGVTKKSKNGRKSVPSSKARRRQERGMDRAEAVMDKKQKKVEKSRGRARTVQERSKAWDELNRKMVAKKVREAALALEKENWLDEEQDAEIGLESAVVDGVKDLAVTDSDMVGEIQIGAGTGVPEEQDEIM